MKIERAARGARFAPIDHATTATSQQRMTPVSCWSRLRKNGKLSEVVTPVSTSSLMARTEIERLAIGAVLFALAFSYPLIGHLSTAGLDADWHQTLGMAWGVWNNVVNLHRFPLTIDWPCTGFPLFAHPESRTLTPLILLHLLFGPVVGAHLEVIAHIALGFAGAYFLARALSISPLGAVAAAITFAGSTWYYLHLSVGHLMFAPFFYAPWVLAFVYLNRYWLAGAIIALMIYEGGTVYPVPNLLLALIILAPILRRFESAALACATGLLFAMPKLAPMLAAFKARPTGIESNDLGTVFHALFLRSSIDQGLGAPWFEYGAYVSPIIALLAFLGLTTNLRQTWGWAVLALLLSAFALGDSGPWFYLHHAPFWAQLGKPERFLILVTLCLAIMAGYGVDRLNPWLAGALLTFALLDFWTLSPRYLERAWREPIAPTPLNLAVFTTREPNVKCDGVWR
jgi:hypothetical protein